MADEPTRESEPTTPTAPGSDRPVASESAADAGLIEEDLLVEDVSIDGMCGVY